MTVNTTETETSTIADGVAVAFAYSFQTLQEAWVYAYTQDPTTLVKTPRTDITVFMNEDQDTNPGGTVTFDVAPDNLDIVTMYRQVPVNQLTDYTEYGPFPAESTEDGLDKLTMIVQQNAAQEGENSYQSPISIINESSGTFPNNMEIRYYASIGGGPIASIEVPYQPGAANGLFGVRTFLADGTLKALLFGGSTSGRGLLLLPDDPEATDVNAAATVQFVLDNAGGPGSNPSYDSVSYQHITDQPTFGDMTVSFDTQTIFTVSVETLTTAPSAPTATDAYGYAWSSFDDAGTSYSTYIINGNVYPPQMVEGVNPPGAQALISREWAEANLAGASTDPVVDSLTVDHDTDPGTYGAFKLTYETFVGLATYRMVRWLPTVPSVANQSFQFSVTDGLGAIHTYNMLDTGIVAPVNANPSPQTLISRQFADDNYKGIFGTAQVTLNGTANPSVQHVAGGVSSVVMNVGTNRVQVNLSGASSMQNLAVTASAENVALPGVAAMICNVQVFTANIIYIYVLNTNNTTLGTDISLNIHVTDAG